MSCFVYIDRLARGWLIGNRAQSAFDTVCRLCLTILRIVGSVTATASFVHGQSRSEKTGREQQEKASVVAATHSHCNGRRGNRLPDVTKQYPGESSVLILACAGKHTFCTLQAVYALGRLAIFYKSSGTRHYVLLTLASLIHFACYSFIKLQAGTSLLCTFFLCAVLGHCRHGQLVALFRRTHLRERGTTSWRVRLEPERQSALLCSRGHLLSGATAGLDRIAVRQVLVVAAGGETNLAKQTKSSIET